MKFVTVLCKSNQKAYILTKGCVFQQGSQDTLKEILLKKISALAKLGDNQWETQRLVLLNFLGENVKISRI